MKYKWTSTANSAMQEVKAAMRKPLKLARPDFTRKFSLQTDASGHGIAAVLFHAREDGGRDVVSYGSARLSETERKYHSNEQEALAAVWAITKYRAYLEDRPFTLITDNTALTWLHRTKDDRAKLTRWAILLSEYSFEIQHCAGAKNQLPDALSRHPSNEPGWDEEYENRVLVPSTTKPFVMSLTLATLPETVREAQSTDAQIQRLITQISDPATNQIRSLLIMRNGLLCRTTANGQHLIVVPARTRKQVMQAYHDDDTAGHPGAAETSRAIRRVYYWRHRKIDVQDYVRRCTICATRKRGAPQRKARPTSHTEAKRPFEVIALDFMGPFPKSTRQNKFLLVVTDLFTRWVEAFPMKNSLTANVLPLLEKEVIYRYGYPRAILTDNGPQFIHALWEGTLEEWGSAHWTTPIYHPQANPTERRNQEIKKALRVHLETSTHRNWDEKIPQILYALRCRKNAATGLAPSHALLGYELSRPGEWSAQIDPPPHRDYAFDRTEQDERMLHQQEAYMRFQNQPDDRLEGRRFTPGEKVYVRNYPRPKVRDGTTAKLAPRWEGPFRIISRIGANTYWLDKRKKPVKVHTDQLRPALEPFAEPADAAVTSPRRHQSRVDSPETDGRGNPELPDEDLLTTPMSPEDV